MDSDGGGRVKEVGNQDPRNPMRPESKRNTVGIWL